MCKIIAVLNKNKENISNIQNFIYGNINDLTKEDDGYSVYKNKNSYFYPNKFVDYQERNLEKNLKYDGEELWITHFRTKTCGEDGKKGLHLQKIDNRYIFAHNGGVTNFCSMQKYNDSYFFFRRIAAQKIVDITSIRDAMEKYTFYGKGFFFDEQTEELHIFSSSQHEVKVHGLNDALIFTTWNADCFYKKREVKTILGYDFLEFGERVDIPFIIKESFKNQYFLFKKGEFIEQYNCQLEWYKSYNGQSIYKA